MVPLLRRGVIKRGLVAEWRLLEGTGTTTADRGPTGYTGTFVNTPNWVATGIDFVTADTDYITTTLIPPVAGTIQCLFAADFFSAARNQIGCLDAANGRCFMNAGDGSTNILTGGIGTQGSAVIKATTVMTAGVWYMGTMTWSGTLVELYTNASREYSAAQSGAVSTTNALWIGARNNNGAPSSAYDGKMTWFAVYNRVLRPWEVARNLRYARHLKAPVGVVVP